MLMEVYYAQYGSCWRNPTEALGLFDPVLNAVATDHSVKISIRLQVIAEEGKVDGQSEGKSFRARPVRWHVQPDGCLS